MEPESWSQETKVGDVGLSDRQKRVLEIYFEDIGWFGVPIDEMTLEEMANMSYLTLAITRNCGPFTMNALRDILARVGLDFKGAPPRANERT